MKEAVKPGKYGYGAPKETGGGYNLKDRGISDALGSRVLAPLAALSEGARVLNLGAGNGHLEKTVGEKRPYHLVSVDLEHAAVSSVRDIFATQGKVEDQAHVGDISQLHAVPGLSPASIDAAVSWRVLHSVPTDLHDEIVKQVYDVLRPGGHFYVAVAAVEDWKVGALGEHYTPGKTNDCSGVMFRDHGIARDHVFPVHFFSTDDLTRLADEAGFFVAGALETFDEPSGYPHLTDKSNTYHFVDLHKPKKGLNGYIAAENVLYQR